MTAPGPVPGTNPYTLAYQTEQYDQGHGADLPHGYGDRSVFDALASPPAAGDAASISPDNLYKENALAPSGAMGYGPPTSSPTPWEADTTYHTKDAVIVSDVILYCLNAGVSGDQTPYLPGLHHTVLDGTIIWEQMTVEGPT